MGHVYLVLSEYEGNQQSGSFWVFYPRKANQRRGQLDLQLQVCCIILTELNFNNYTSTCTCLGTYALKAFL